MNYNFEWDLNKDKSNYLKHKINFESASGVFKDSYAISIYDEKHSENEERWITIGMEVATRIIVVVHTFVEINENNYNIRIISARKATKKEIKTYNKGHYERRI
jgi:uncharacterized DUF497 family protein